MTKPSRKDTAAPDALPTQRFRAVLTRNAGATGSWTWIDIPARVSRAFAPWVKSGHVRVDVTLNGKAAQGSFMPRGGGRHLMLISAAMRRETGVSHGDTVEVVATPRVTDDVRLPDDLAAALKAHDARAAFDAMASSHRWELVRYVSGARTDSTRARYVTRVVEHVLGKAPAVTEASPRRASKGWYCPECGRRFQRVDAEHPCEPVSLEVPFAGKTAEVRGIFEALRAKLAARGGVTMVVHREGVSFVGARRFLWVIPRKSWIELRLLMARRVEQPGVKAYTMGPSQHSNALQLRTLAALDDGVMALVREAIAYGAPVEAMAPEPRTQEPSPRSGWDRDVDDSFFEGLGEV